MLHGLVKVNYVLFQAATIEIWLHKPKWSKKTLKSAQFCLDWTKSRNEPFYFEKKGSIFKKALN